MKTKHFTLLLISHAIPGTVTSLGSLLASPTSRTSTRTYFLKQYQVPVLATTVVVSNNTTCTTVPGRIDQK